MIVDVEPGMTLAQVIMRLREAHGDSVTIRISPDTSLLLTANEFRALALAAEREQVAIAVETSDGLRQQLASLFGVPLAVPVESPLDDTSGADVAADANDVAPIVQLRPPNQELDDAETTTTTQPLQASGARRRSSNDRQRRSVSLRKLLLGAALLLLVGIVGIAAYWQFFRSATVDLTLQSQPVSANINFTVVRQGEGASVPEGAILAEPVSFQLSVEQSGQATGVETIGGTTASGSLVLRNPGSESVVIEAGTTIETFEGDAFVFPEDVSVPGATPGGSAGEVTAPIDAAEAGAQGNRDAGMLSGRLDNGVYYSNRGTPVAGGGDQTRTVVTQEDLDRLQAEAQAALESLASTSSLSGNRRVVPSTLTQRDFTAEFSHQVGEEAESITIDAMVHFDALAFSTEALQAAAEAALASSTPQGYTLAADSLVYEVPVESGESDGAIEMIVPVRGTTRLAISQEEIDQLLEELEGASAEDARSVLSQDERIENFDIRFSPDWLPHTMPNDAGRIEVNFE